MSDHRTWICSACKIEIQAPDVDGGPGVNGWGARRHMVGSPPNCVVDSRGDLTCPDCLKKKPPTGRDFDVVFWDGRFRILHTVNGEYVFMQAIPQARRQRFRAPRPRRRR